jgi:hypothetical protein
LKSTVRGGGKEQAITIEPKWPAWKGKKQESFVYIKWTLSFVSVKF